MFTGFSAEACAFLRQVEDNNSKQWYQENKDRYVRYVKEPYAELIMALSPLLRDIDKQIVLEPARCLSRIYRDTRFSKCKLLYRSSTWVTFKRQSDDSLAQPCFYVEFTDCSCDVGMGYWSAKASSMAAYRKMISDDPQAFMKIVAPILRDRDLSVRGIDYQRIPAGCPDVDGIDVWYRKKNVHVSTGNMPPQKAFDSSFADFAAEKIRAAAPLYKKLLEVEAHRVDGETVQTKRIIRQEFEW